MVMRGMVGGREAGREAGRGDDDTETVFFSSPFLRVRIGGGGRRRKMGGWVG